MTEGERVFNTHAHIYTEHFSEHNIIEYFSVLSFYLLRFFLLFSSIHVWCLQTFAHFSVCLNFLIIFGRLEECVRIRFSCYFFSLYLSHSFDFFQAAFLWICSMTIESSSKWYSNKKSTKIMKKKYIRSNHVNRNWNTKTIVFIYRSISSTQHTWRHTKSNGMPTKSKPYHTQWDIASKMKTTIDCNLSFGYVLCEYDLMTDFIGMSLYGEKLLYDGPSLLSFACHVRRLF